MEAQLQLIRLGKLIKAARNQALLGLTARNWAPQENEINTARRLLKIGFAPADWLYSESLTKSTKKESSSNSTSYTEAPTATPKVATLVRTTSFDSYLCNLSLGRRYFEIREPKSTDTLFAC
jgi:predicted P-loop ATPase